MEFAGFPWGISQPLANIAKRYVWSIPIVGVLGFLGNGLEGLGISLLIPFLAGLFSGGSPISLPGPLSMLTKLIALLPTDGRLYAVAGVVFASIFLKAIILTLNAVLVAWVDGQAGEGKTRA